MRVLVWMALLATLSLEAQVPGVQGNWREVRSPHFVVQGNGGESQLREVALQFESMREVFRKMFPGLRVDQGIPTRILAARDEVTMQQLLPEFWSRPKQSHPAGVWAGGRERNYAVINLAAGWGELPYQTIYHELTHGLIRLNFSAPPVWLEEGLCEFYGNTQFGRSEIGVGQIGQWQLAMLHGRPLIPMAEFLSADQSSPHYTESGRTTLFYAQAWLMVHYLLMDERAVKEGLFRKFLQALEATRNAGLAGEQAFGDLKAFEQRLRGYARSPVFGYLRLKPFSQLDARTFEARPLSQAAALAVSAAFRSRRHSEEALKDLERALEADPGLGEAHLALGALALREGRLDAAEARLREACRLSAGEFLPPFLLAECLLRKGAPEGERGREVSALLDRSIQLNPDYAPAHHLLSFHHLAEGKEPAKAVATALKALQLDPGNLGYFHTLVEAYLGFGRRDLAEQAVRRMETMARTEGERAMVASLKARLRPASAMDFDDLAGQGL